MYATKSFWIFSTVQNSKNTCLGLFFGSFRQFVPLFKVFQVNNLSIRQKVKKMYQCALDSAGLSISTLIMFTDDCRSFQATTGIREKTAHTRHHQKLEKGKKKENCLQVLCVFVGFSVLMLCAFLGGLLLIIALGAGLIGRAGLSTHSRT